MKYYVFLYTGRPIGESGERCNSKYNLELSCPACGTGAKLEGNLRTKAISKIKKDLFETLNGDYIISNNLYDKLIKEGIMIGNLKNIVDSKNNELLFFHLNADLYFPKAIKKGGLVIENQCQVCKRNGFFTKAIIGNLNENIPTQVFQSELHYSKIEDEFLKQSDFFYTWECLGLSNRIAYENYVIRYARPMLVVSEHFREVLENCKIKNIEFEPIIINR